MNVFVVSSPLQLLSAIEAKHYFKLSAEECMLIILRDRGKQKDSVYRIKNMISDNDWGKTEFIGNGKSIFSWFIYSKQLSNISKSLNKVKNIYIGDYSRKFTRDFVNNLEHDKIFLLDDGTGTLKTHNYLTSKLNSYDNSFKVKELTRRLIRKYILKFDVTSSEIVSTVNYFTVYNLSQKKDEIIIKNNYNYLRNLVKEKELSDHIWFLGTPLYENKLIGLDTYIKYLEKIKSYFTSKKLVYIPHRFETPEKLAYLEKNLGLTIRHTKTCIEYELCMGDVIPSTLATFFSSAVDSCRCIFQDQIKIKSFYIESKDLKEDYVETAQSCYSYYQDNYKHNFEIVNLNITN